MQNIISSQPLIFYLYFKPWTIVRQNPAAAANDFCICFLFVKTFIKFCESFPVTLLVSSQFELDFPRHYTSLFIRMLLLIQWSAKTVEVKNIDHLVTMSCQETEGMDTREDVLWHALPHHKEC